MDKFLCDHLTSHPLAASQDAAKFLFQRNFAGGHMIDNTAACIDRLRAEMSVMQSGCLSHELLGNRLARLSLPAAEEAGLGVSAIARMFCLTANTHVGNKSLFLRDLNIDLPISGWKSFVNDYLSSGCPDLHHSNIYRHAYNPAYRVVRSEFIPLIPVISSIDSALAEQECVTVAIDGPCGSGKTTLASSLAALYDANLFHTDDFFPQPHQRTDGRLNIPGGNLDHERLLDQVLIPICNRMPVSAQKFSCSRLSLSEPENYPLKRVNILEGSYSHHPIFGDYTDIKVFVHVSKNTQRTRLTARGSNYNIFESRWIPLENVYFESCCVEKAADFIIENEEDDR